METNHFQFTSLNASRIIKDESTLLPQFLEGDIFCKKHVEDKIVASLKPISEGRLCENLFIYGPNGAGKTTLIKHVLDHLKDYNRRVACLYINCWYHSTSMAIYTKIADALGESASRRGRATDETFDRIIEVMGKTKTPVLLVLDEVDGLIYRRETKILHNITNIEDSNILFGTVCISDAKTVLSKIQPKINGGLGFTPLEISGYAKEELFTLLKNRAEKCLLEGSYNNNTLERIAEIGATSKGNGRLALEILWKSAKHATAKGNRAITLEDIEEVGNSINDWQATLSREERIIIDILKTGEKSSSELYWLFYKHLVRSKRQIRNYLACLEGKGVIETRIVELGNRQCFKLIKLKNPAGG